MNNTEKLKSNLCYMKHEIKKREYRGLIANSSYVQGYINAIDEVLIVIENNELECIDKSILEEE